MWTFLWPAAIAAVVVLAAQPSRMVAHLGLLAAELVGLLLSLQQTRRTANGGFVGEGHFYAGALMLLDTAWLVMVAVVTTLAVWRLGQSASRVVVIHVVVVLVAPTVLRVVWWLLLP